MLTSIIVLSILNILPWTMSLASTDRNCPNVTMKQNFDINRYLGQWYAIESFPAVFQWGLSCIQANYSLNLDGTIMVRNSGTFNFKIFGRSIYKYKRNIDGTATIVNSAQPAGLRVQFPGQPVFDKSKANYIIMDTDFENYSLVYSCSKLLNIFPKMELAWILSRRPGEKPTQTSQLKALLASFNVDVSQFQTIDFSSC